MLRVERESHHVVWTIDRAETKNALDFSTIDALRDAAREAAADHGIRCAVLTGAGHTFVSGGDLRELRGRTTPQDGERLSDAGYELTTALAELPFPVIGALAGPAVGGGAELALACDMRVADARAKICFKQGRMGVTTAWGSAARLVALIGPSMAARLLYTGYEMPAVEAKLAGLVDEVVENGMARATAVAWAADVAQASPAAVRAMKAILREGARAAESARAVERQLFIDTWSGADHIEAVDAYFERRAPVWHDR